MATDLKELAVSYWRMERWLSYTNVERKMAATSALRTIKKFLDTNGIEVLDLTGNGYDPGMAVDVINSDVPENLEKSDIIVSEMIKPIIMQNGTVIQFGQVSIGLTVKQIAENKTKNEDNSAMQSETAKDMYAEILELSNYIKSKKKAYLGYSGMLACILIIFMIIVSILLFMMNNAIKNKSVSQEFIPTQIEIANDIINKENESKATRDVCVQFAEYEIQEEDSLLSICEKNNIDYNTSIGYIKSINGILDADKIYIGQKILIPVNNVEVK